MAKKYKKDIKVVLPHIDPFRDIAVYGAGEEMIKALGGQLADKGKQPDIIPTSNSPYFKKGIKKFGKGGYKRKYADGGIEKPTFGRSETYAEFAKNEAMRKEITAPDQIKQNKSNKFSYKQKDKVKNPEYEIQLPELTIRPEESSKKELDISINPTKQPPAFNFIPPRIPGSMQEAQAMLDSGELKASPPDYSFGTKQQAKLALKLLGLKYPAAAVAGSLWDVYEGNYKEAALNVMPFKKFGVIGQGTGAAINANDVYDQFMKVRKEREAYKKNKNYSKGGVIKKFGDGGKKQTVIHTDKALFDKAYKAEMDSMRLYNLSGKLASGNYVYPENYQFPDNPKYIEDYKVKYSPTGLDDGQKIGGSSTKQREIVEKSLKEKIKPLGYTYRDFAVPVYQKPRVKNILQERKPNLESIATRPMDLSSMNVGEDYSILTPKSNKKESKLKRLSPYTSSTSQYKGEIVDSEGRKELTKQEYEEAVKKYGEGYFKAYGGPINNTNNMKKVNKKGQNPRSILSPEQRMAIEFGWGGAIGSALGAAAGTFLVPGLGTGLGASIGGSLGSAIDGSIENKKQSNQQYQPQQYQQALPQQMQFAKGGKLNKRGIPNRGISEQMPYQTQMQSYPNLEFGNGEQMLAMGGELEDIEMYKEGGIYIKPSKRGTFTAAAKKRNMGVQEFAGKVLANKENYSPAMVKKANFARNAAKWKHEDGGFLQEPEEGVIERRNKNRSREPQEYATFEENFKHMYADGGLIKRADGSYSKRGLWDNIRANAGSGKKPTKEMLSQERKIKAEEKAMGGYMYAQGGRMGAMGPMDVGNIYYDNGGEKQNDPENINHLQWGKYIDDPKRREQHIVDVYQNLMDSRWDPKDINEFMKDAGGYGSKSRGDLVKSGSVWGWDHEDITDEVLGKAWDDYYKKSNTTSKYNNGGKKEGPRNILDITGNYSSTVNPNMLQNQKEAAAKLELKRIMGASGNAELGLTGNINYNNPMQPMNEEDLSVMSRKNPNVTGNIGVTGSYNRGNSSFTGGLGYDPISKTTTGNVGFRKQWGNGGHRMRYHDTYDKSPLQSSTTVGTEGVTNSTRYNINDLETPMVVDFKTGWNPNSKTYENEKISKDLGLRINPLLWQSNRASLRGDVKTGLRSDVSENPAENKFPFTGYADVGLRGRVIGKGRDYNTGATKRELNFGATYDLAHGYNADATFDFFKNKNMDLGAYATGSYNSETKDFKPTAGLRANFKFQRADGGMLNHYNGYKHEDGGIPIGPRSEVEDGETSMKMGMGGEKDSTYIFSDQLIVPGKKYTYADGSKKIDSKYGRRTNDKLSDESKKRELNKLMESQEQVRQAKEAQEQNMVQNAYQTIAAYGGPINKYPWGGLNAPTLQNSTKLPFNPLPFYNVPNSIYNNASNASMPNDLNFKKSFEVNPADNFKFNTSMPKNAFGKEIAQMPSTPNQPAPPYINVPVTGMTSQGSTVNPDNSITSDSFGTGEQWARGLGYGIQGAGLLARQLQLSSKKNKLSPNKAFTMERQVLNAEPQLREADISAAIANRNIRDLGASTSSGGAMAGYLAAQAGRTRSKADIMADLQNRQAQIDMTTGQYNTMAGERAYDKDAADLAAQQTSQAQLFADMSKLGSGVTRDYLLGQSQEGLMESAYNPYFKYKKQKGRNKYNTEYTG